MKENNKIKYFAYVRKSTEGTERQALSIESQKDKALEFFSNLEVVEVLEESHSAFSPFERPVFADMIKRIRKGEAQGIIAWHPDRLSRNEIDASTITYLVRTGVIKDLKFASYNFDNSPEGVMMLQLALSQSQYFSSKLSKDVWRGLEKKFLMGWQPNKAPEGYINKRSEDTGLSIITVDPVPFKLLRKAFDLMLTGNYTVAEVLDKLNDEWGFRTKQAKSFGGKAISRSAFYRIFTNLFYAGIISFCDREGSGKHKSMITLDEYDKIQVILGRNGKPRRRKYDFPYRGLIRCKQCGGVITADFKHNFLKLTKEVKTFTYYHCAHRKGDKSCNQPSIGNSALESQIIDKIMKYSLRPEFLELALEIIDDLKGDKVAQDEVVRASAIKSLTKLKLELKNLTKMKCRNLLSDDEYLESKEELNRDINKLQVTEYCDEDTEAEILKLTKETFEFVCNGMNSFLKGNSEKKKTIFSALGSKYFIENKTLEILAYKWLLPIEKSRSLLNEKMAVSDCNKMPIDTGRKMLLEVLNPVLLAERDSD